MIQRVCSAENENAFLSVGGEIPKRYRARTLPLLRQFRALYARDDYGRSSSYLDAEKRFVVNVNTVKAALKRENPFDHFLFTPIRSAKYLLSKSQLNLFIFQDTFRGTLPMEALRLLAVFLINGGVLSCIVLLFPRMSGSVRAIALAVLIYLFYLFFFQRMNEERYLAPLLPILLILLCITTRELYLRFRVRTESPQ